MQNSWIAGHSYDKPQGKSSKKAKPATNSCWTKFYKPVGKITNFLPLMHLGDLYKMLQCFKMAE